MFDCTGHPQIHKITNRLGSILHCQNTTIIPTMQNLDNPSDFKKLLQLQVQKKNCASLFLYTVNLYNTRLLTVLVVVYKMDEEFLCLHQMIDAFHLVLLNIHLFHLLGSSPANINITYVNSHFSHKKRKRRIRQPASAELFGWREAMTGNTSAG